MVTKNKNGIPSARNISSGQMPAPVFLLLRCRVWGLCRTLGCYCTYSLFTLLLMVQFAPFQKPWLPLLSRFGGITWWDLPELYGKSHQRSPEPNQSIHRLGEHRGVGVRSLPLHLQPTVDVHLDATTHIETELHLVAGFQINWL